MSEEIKKLEYEKEQLNNYGKDIIEFIKFGIHVIKNIGSFFEKSTVNTKQKLISSIFKEKLIFDKSMFYRDWKIKTGDYLSIISR